MGNPPVLRGRGLLSHIQRTFLALFAQLPDQSAFSLTGGTVLAEFYLEHRLSFDLDFFTVEESLILPSSYQVEASVQRLGVQMSVVRRFST